MKSAVLILTHGRADNVVTVKTLRQSGYSGEIYIVIDNTDEQEEEYKRIYGANVIVFDKFAAFTKTDTMDNFAGHNVVVFARNQCHEIARGLGLTHFCVLDDDYTSFEYRYPEDGVLKIKKIKELDEIFSLMYSFLDVSGALSVAMAQGGDFIGGVGNTLTKRKFSRKAMNSWFCRTDRPFQFVGRINEDANTVALLGSQGGLFFTLTQIMLAQVTTQKNKGGLTDIYLELGTYVKSFYSVIAMPSAVTVQLMGDKHMRLHHNVSWNNCVPKILSETSKKE